ncbi:MAG: putative rRNA maturation factor [Maribacter sp.]|jgi:probable rRNA maturation factor
MFFYSVDPPILKNIQYISEDIDFCIDDEKRISDWIMKVVQEEKKQIKSVTYIYCSDEYLYNINLTYLNHDTYTDIITFPLSYSPIESDIFISIDRVKENAKKFAVDFKTELHRVVIHGILHLCGYKDKTDEEQALMTQKENEALTLLHNIT